MAKNELIRVLCFGEEIGKIGFNADLNRTSFQYHPNYLKQSSYKNLFPQTGILKRVSQPQLFSRYNNDTFKGLPPMFADSLPDVFGNIIFKKWLEVNHQSFDHISILEQLAYVSNRGMGALEYQPSFDFSSKNKIDLTEIIGVLKEVLLNKNRTQLEALNHEALLNIYKMGTSAGGARPKLLVSENINTGEIVPGDVFSSADYNHYIVKLALDDEHGYCREIIEYCYYLTATYLGIKMMPSKLIDSKHFATLRFDRQDGQKKHMLTVSGLTGWDFQSPKDSSYENLFELALFLKIPARERDELFKRMVFNVVFCNTDDHLKNHTFIYNEIEDEWNISPAYDLTYSLNPLLNFKKVSRALSINGKRVEIKLNDILSLAERFTVKNPKKIINQIQEGIPFWLNQAVLQGIPTSIIEKIHSDFKKLV